MPVKGEVVLAGLAKKSAGLDNATNVGRYLLVEIEGTWRLS